MKQLLFSIIICCFIGPRLYSQAALEVYSPEKKRFYLFVDGLKENESPKAKVRIKNLPEGPHHIKVIFEQRDINNPQIKVELDRAKDYQYAVKLYTNLDRKWYAFDLENVQDWTEKEVRKNANEDSLSASELAQAEQVADSILIANEPKPVIEKPKDTVLQVTDTIASAIDKSKLNCTTPMHPKGFNLLLEQIESEADDNLKIAKSKTILEKNCLSSIQIMELLQLFEFEVSKLEVASYAYSYCFDPLNYQFIEDVFEFDSSVIELHNRIYAEKK